VKALATLFILSGVALWGSGCGTTEETAQPSPPEPKPVVKEEPPPRVQFESRTDTVAVVHATAPDSSAPTGKQPEIRYLVQIGAFRDPQLATAAQAAARSRYQLPVLNDYNPLVGLYQIRIGSFLTREAANEFKSRMQKEFPADYRDSWIVQLRQ
jgi:cell division septation protein DedD